jgi:PIN domain nuclease of toxin-antitoxin system
MGTVIDASALTAWLLGEPGAEVAERVIVEGAAISAVNVTETITRLMRNGLSWQEGAAHIDEVDVFVVPFTRDQSVEAARLAPVTAGLGMSLADRACLATARALGARVVTADRAWSKLDPSVTGVEIELIR